MRVFKALRIGRRSIKGDERGKPQISIPQKSAVAIVPPKKVRTLGYGLDNPKWFPAGKQTPLCGPGGWLPFSRASTNR
jgi:hypothetical protein